MRPTLNTGKYPGFKSGRRFSLAFLSITLALASGAAQEQTTKPDDAAQPRPRQRLKLTLPNEAPPSSATATGNATFSTRQFEIPNGIPIRMRLAQPVRGVTRSLIKIKVHSQEGDIVRLVVADDVRVNGMIVIPKGAVGLGHP